MFKDNAQKIAEYTSQICGHTVIVTDENAIIIGSSDPERLGQVNDAAKKVIQRRAPLEPFPGYIDGMANTKPGITLPIEIGKRIYGAIGIQGVRAEVEKYGLLLKKYSELFLRDSIFLQTSQIRENALNDFLYELVSFNPQEESAEYLLMRGYDLSFNLNLPRVALIIDLRFAEKSGHIKNQPVNSDFKDFDRMINTIQFRSIIRKIFSDPEDLVAPGKNRKIVILHNLVKKHNPQEEEDHILGKCHELQDAFKKNRIKAIIAIGSRSTKVEELSLSLKEARDLINLSHLPGREKLDILQTRYFLIEQTLHELPKTQKDWLAARALKLLKQQPDWKDLADTLEKWGESMFHQGDAAKALGIHRNTLSYRLDRIHILSGYNPRVFKDALALYLAIFLERSV